MLNKFVLLCASMLTFAHCTAQKKESTEKTKNLMTENPNYQIAIFASGCFWGTEFYLQKADGVIATTVGYIGGTTNNPTYEQVCAKKTGHYEAVEVVFDPQKTSFETLTKLFFETHDPTQTNGQGPDIGPQYRSAIFYQNEAQKTTSEKLIRTLQGKGYKVATVLLPAATFWPAELYHQDYYNNKGGTPYCHSYTKRF